MRWGTLICICLSLFLFSELAPANAQGKNPQCFKRAGGVIAPIGNTRTLPRYPSASVTLGEQGTVVLRIYIGKDGVPVDVEVEKSSGFQRLDDVTASWVKQFWRWFPFEDSECPIVNVLVSSKWELRDVREGIPSFNANLRIVAQSTEYPPEARERKAEGVTKMEIFVGQAGQILNRRLVTSSGHTDLDLKASEIITNFPIRAAEIAGMPAQSSILVEIVWSLDGNDPLRP